MFVVTTPAVDRSILNLEEMREALEGVSSDRDDDLQNLGRRVSDLIAAECGVPEDGVNVPTLLSETITEDVCAWGRGTIMLSRMRVTQIVSVTDGDLLLAADGYRLNAAAGMLSRLNGGRAYGWGRRSVIVYKAGFERPPGDLQLAFLTILREQLAATSRDPLLKRENVPGVGEAEYWTGGLDPGNGAAMSSQARAMLARFRYPPRL